MSKSNNLYFDPALNKSININLDAGGSINSYGLCTHNNDLSANNIKAISFLENNVSLTNKSVEKIWFFHF